MSVSGAEKTPAVRVLVVDDDEYLLRALRRRLRDDPDVELITLDDPIDALLVVGAVNPDLVVIDAYMPGIDGLEVCRRIKSNDATKDLQVVVTSASVSDELVEAALEAGATRAVAKPLDVPELVRDMGSLDDPETVRLKRAIAAAQKRLHHAEVELLELQRQRLARGTEDVAEKAREAVRLAAADADDELSKLS